jgi:hypothetical protein
MLAILKLFAQQQPANQQKDSFFSAGARGSIRHKSE